MSTVALARVAASAACRAGCSGRHNIDVDTGGAKNVTGRLFGGGGTRLPVRQKGPRVCVSWHAQHVRERRRRSGIVGFSAVAAGSGSGNVTPGRGSQAAPVRSTLVPEPLVAILSNSLIKPAGETRTSDDETTTNEDLQTTLVPLEEDQAAQIARRILPSGLQVIVATDASEFEVAAELRAVAFYEDLEARQQLPFPPRFVATFRREFAQRERKALRERTHKPSGPSRKCLCLMASVPQMGLVGCLDVSTRDGPCCSQVNGLCVRHGETYVYIDNVAVDAGARRKGSASAMLEASSDVAASWGAGFIYTHVHASNVAARRLYHAYGFRAPNGKPIHESLSPGAAAAWTNPRLQGLVLLRAPLPLMQAASEKAAAAVGDCTCGAKYDDCDECVCKPGGV
jgi:ribosomal protein S18 acetylase RimI-like enzyme